MKKFINTNMKSIQLIVLTVVMLLTASAVGAVNYPTYKPSRQAVVPHTGVVAQPTQRVNSITPMLNEDGTAVNPYAEAPGASRPRRDPIFDGPGTTGNDNPPEPGTPIGSAWVLLLFALGYAGLTAYHRRRRV